MHLEQLGHFNLERHVKRRLCYGRQRRRVHARHRSLRGRQGQDAHDLSQNRVVISPNVARHEARICGGADDLVIRIRRIQSSLQLHRHRQTRQLARPVVPLRLTRTLVVVLILVRPEPRRHRTQRHHPRAVALHQLRQQQRREHEVSEIIHPHAYVVPLFRRLRSTVSARPVQSRVIHQDVQFFILLPKLFRERPDARGVAQIERHHRHVVRAPV